MGNCRFCGKPAGFLRHQHKQCRRAHDGATAKIVSFFPKFMHDPMAANRFRELIDQDAAQNYVKPDECDQLVRQGLGTVIRAAVDREQGLSSADDERIDELQKAFGLTLNTLGPSGTVLAKARILRAIDTGKVSTINIQLDGNLAPRLEDNERPIWSFNGVNYLTMRARTQYVGHSSGVSIRIAKGLYYRTGAYRGEPIRSEYLSNEDRGSLTITDHNVYFVGAHRALKIPLNKIASCHLYSDGIEILRNGVTAKPSVFTLDDPAFAANLLSRLPGG